MEIIGESLNFENKEMLPHILMRIFSVCKADPNFPLKGQISSVEGEIDTLISKVAKKQKLIGQTNRLRDDLSNRLQSVRQDNFELKSRLLEELGSEI